MNFDDTENFKVIPLPPPSIDHEIIDLIKRAFPNCTERMLKVLIDMHGDLELMRYHNTVDDIESRYTTTHEELPSADLVDLDYEPILVHFASEFRV